MKKILTVLSLAAAVWGGSLLAGSSDTKPRRITLFFSGWVTGTFGPCGCKVDPNGGFPRRAGFSRAYQKEVGTPVIQVDAGSLFEKPGPTAASINQAMLKGLAQLPVHVMNLGSEDLHMWPELSRLREASTQFISSNLRARAAGQPQPKPYAILRFSAAETGLEKDLRIGFLGIVDPARVKPNSGFRGQDPMTAVSDAMQEIRDQVDFVVVLADYFRRGPIEPGSILHTLATENPEIYAVITTERQYLMHSSEQVNNAIILSSIERGRQLGQLVFEFDEEGKVASYEAEFVNLDASVPEDPELAKELPNSGSN